MVPIIKAYKCRLEWVTKSVLIANYKSGNTSKQVFHAWRTFHFDENTETLNSYITCFRQVATLLGYDEPQVLEVFKNALPTTLY